MNLRSKPFWITLLVTYFYIAGLNYVAHSFIIVSFIAGAMTAINADFSQFRVYFLMLTWFVITFGTVYFTLRDRSQTNRITQAIITGIFISVIADGTWVFTNIAFVPTIHAFPFAIAELTWHSIHGAFGGILALKTYDWAKARF